MHAFTGKLGFTLFEVAISLLILSVAMLSSLMVFPVGIKAQHLARFQIYAGVKAIEIMDNWTNDSHTYWERQTEAEKLGQCTLMRWSVDLDHALENPVFGLMPLPRALAARIDSEGDEIAHLLDAGGQLFYVAPWSYDAGYDMRLAQGDQYANLSGQGINVAPQETQTLLFAVLGYAQQNALPNHPCLAWPYYEFYPAPAQPWERDAWLDPANAWPNQTEFVALYDRVNGDSYDGLCGDVAAIDDYLIKAQNLLRSLGVPMTNVAGVGDAPNMPLALPSSPWDSADQNAYPKPWTILALRYLAHAAASRTSKALPAPADVSAFNDYADRCHEAALAWCMRYVSGSPYDWGAPRPLNRQTCFDFPLLEYDLFSPPRAVGDGTGDVSWPIIAGSEPRNFGNARGVYGGWPSQGIAPNRAQTAGSWGDHSHFNLTTRFDAAERARRLMCWSADWRSFEDFEELPADAYDSNMHFMDSRGVDVCSERTGQTGDLGLHFADPDRTTIYHLIDKGTMMAGPRAEWDTVAFKRTYLGLNGVDRNGNATYDRGPLPKSARIRASVVASFDYYDRRFIAGIRN